MSEGYFFANDFAAPEDQRNRCLGVEQFYVGVPINYARIDDQESKKIFEKDPANNTIETNSSSTYNEDLKIDVENGVAQIPFMHKELRQLTWMHGLTFKYSGGDGLIVRVL
ncbi:hypothetical protein RF11_08576 [Thelohanellus kitauei]|uniref:Uncharacterized protein n=1 Tax=Thelohanellus kitauei TaxID=669202 RepID=A0A0C2MBF4_THEKT|nr:hypothetical protein RF11_08576 [Thelohanellus kitauei]